MGMSAAAKTASAAGGAGTGDPLPDIGVEGTEMGDSSLDAAALVASAMMPGTWPTAICAAVAEIVAAAERPAALPAEPNSTAAGGDAAASTNINSAPAVGASATRAEQQKFTDRAAAEETASGAVVAAEMTGAATGAGGVSVVFSTGFSAAAAEADSDAMKAEISILDCSIMSLTLGENLTPEENSPANLFISGPPVDD
jgi:hypothetical protein